MSQGKNIFDNHVQLPSILNGYVPNGCSPGCQCAKLSMIIGELLKGKGPNSRPFTCEFFDATREVKRKIMER